METTGYHPFTSLTPQTTSQPLRLPLIHVIQTVVLGYISQVGSSKYPYLVGVVLICLREMAQIGRGHALWFVARFSLVYPT